MNFNNFKKIYLNSDYTILSENSIIGKTFINNKKNKYIRSGQKYNIELFQDKLGINKKVLLKKNINYSITQYKKPWINLINKNKFLNKSTNTFCINFARYSKNVLSIDTNGKYCILLKKKKDKDLIKLIKRRHLCYIAKTKYITPYSNKIIYTTDKKPYFKRMLISILAINSFKFLKNKLI